MFQVAAVGPEVDLTYRYDHLGNSVSALKDIVAGGPVLDAMKSADKPLVIVGPGILERPDKDAVLALVNDLVVKTGEGGRPSRITL